MYIKQSDMDYFFIRESSKPHLSGIINAKTKRLTSECAARHNELVTALLEHIVIAHASANGGLIRPLMV